MMADLAANVARVRARIAEAAVAPAVARRMSSWWR